MKMTFRRAGFWLVLPAIFLAALAFMDVSRAEVDTIATFGSGGKFDVDIFDTDTEDYGENLYRNVLNRVRNETKNLAVTRTLDRYQFSQEELFAMISGTNIAGLLTKQPGEPLSPQQVETRRQEVETAYTNEKDLADLEVLTGLEVNATEIFSNGDLEDSGFDLIEDLNIIDQILFGTIQTELSTAGPGAPGSRVVPLFGGGSGSAGAGREEEESGEGSGRAPGSGGSSAEEDIVEVEPSPEEEEVICAAEQSFHDAVVAARARERSAAGAGSGSDDGGPASGRNGAGGSGDSRDASNGGSSPLTPAPPAVWNREKPCDDVFCLNVEFVTKKESSYVASDNCVACHIEKMNDAFKKTLDHGLTPSKATGNLFEPSTCKYGTQFSDLLDFSLIVVPQPALTPPNDDLIPKINILNNFDEMLKKYYDNPGRCDNGAAGGACKPDGDPTEEAARNILNQATDVTEQDKLLNRIRSDAETKKKEIEEEMRKARLAKEAATFASQYQAIAQELSAMNGYFSGFATLFQQLSPNNSDSPCSVLLDKETCE